MRATEGSLSEAKRRKKDKLIALQDLKILNRKSPMSGFISADDLHYSQASGPSMSHDLRMISPLVRKEP